MRTRPELLLALVALLVGGSLGGVAAAAVLAPRAAAERDRADELAAEVAALEARVAELEAERAGAPTDAEDGPLADLFGGGDAADLLDELLAGVSGDLPGLRCLTPATDGGPGGLLGGLGELFGDGAARDDPERDTAGIVAEVADQVADLRELDAEGGFEVDLLDAGELADEIETMLAEELDEEELAARTDVLVALRAVPADLDLAVVQRDLLTGQVAGFYDPDDGRLVVRVPDDGQLRPLDRVTLAHELGHAIVDRTIGLPDLEDDLDGDAALARLAVIEGDATLLMHRWALEHLSFAEQLGMAGAGDLVGQQEQLAALPHHLTRELLFPYTVGLDLVCDRWLDGGWAAVDATYADPPTTTAGALFPERADETPLDPPELAVPPGGTPRLTDTFGAAPLLWLFEAPGGDTDAALSEPVERVAAWAGGEVVLWDVAGDPVVGVALAARDGAGAALCASVTAWYEAAAPDAAREDVDGTVRFTDADGVAVLRCDDGIRFAVADDAATATSVVSP
jgi:hypothetical protein